MTLIIAARASDGIVIGADQKTSGFEPEYGTKIFRECQSLWSAAGFVGIRDDLLDMIRQEEQASRGFGTLFQLRQLAEDLIEKMQKRYGERLETPATIQAILGGLEQLGAGRASIYVIGSEGYGQRVDTFAAIGSGRDYATSLAKFLLDPEKDVTYNAQVIAFCIAWVAEDLDAGVGGTPEIQCILDNDPAPLELDQYIVDGMVSLADDWKQNLPAKLAPDWKRCEELAAQLTPVDLFLAEEAEEGQSEVEGEGEGEDADNDQDEDEDDLAKFVEMKPRRQSDPAGEVREECIAWFNLGVTQLKQQKFAGAIEAYEKVLALDPKHQYPWTNVAQRNLEYARERIKEQGPIDGSKNNHKKKKAMWRNT